MRRTLRPLALATVPLLTFLAADLPLQHLPGELSADAVLNGEYPYPPSPAVRVQDAAEGFAADRMGQVPAPGVHPRLLFSPEQIPDLRARIAGSATGRALLAQLRARTGATIHQAGTWEHEFHRLLVQGDVAKALAVYDAGKAKPSDKTGHYQPHPLYPLVLDAFDALIHGDKAQGEIAAKALAGYARMIAPLLEESLASPMADDVWRVKVQGPVTGTSGDRQGLRDLMGYHLVGYGYDFAAPFMDEAQKAEVRRVISRATTGRLWMGARLPHHFRNWNWCAVALSQPLLGLAIEGEEGFDPRVYQLGVACARDYLTYGISEKGSSTEAVGYTQFGFVWANPFIVAASRRGERLLTHGHFRAMLDWYVHAAEPWGRTWVSHGDGGDGGPSLGTALLWNWFLPGDARAAEVLRQVCPSEGEIAKGRDHLIEMLAWCADPAATPAAPALSPTWFDPARSSLIARAGTGPDAAVLQFECRTDSVGASHEHADKGAFTFSALGRPWAKDYFRSIESRHHNVVLIDGKGQGFWPGPGRWLGQVDAGFATIAACDAADAYRWQWPKTILTDPLDPAASPRFAFPRWSSYLPEAKQWQQDWAGVPVARDDRPSVVAHWQGFADVAGGPRMWDEDGWPVRVPWNPVQRAFRTVALARGAHPYALIVDDIRQDDQVHLYEWGMMTGYDTEVVSTLSGAGVGFGGATSDTRGDELILADASVARDGEGRPKPKKGDRLLLVRILNRNVPALARDYATMPSIRLETYERRDFTKVEGRGFGLDRRLIIPTRAVAPDFKILLVPFRQGEALPKTVWNAERTQVTITQDGTMDTVAFAPDADGRTRVSITREGKTAVLP